MLAGMALKWRWRQRGGRRAGHRPAQPDHRDPTSRSSGRSSAGTGTSSPAISPCSDGRYVITPTRWSRGSTRTPSASSPSSVRPTPVSSNRSRRSTTPWSPTTRRPSGRPGACGRRQRRFRRTVPCTQTSFWDFRLPLVQIDQCLGAQVRARLSRESASSSGATRRGPTRGPCLPRELPGRGHAHVHPELLAAREPDHRPSTTTSCG